jgi:hypothetical protein
MPDLDNLPTPTPESLAAGAMGAAAGVPGMGLLTAITQRSNGTSTGGSGMSDIGSARDKIASGNDEMDGVEQNLGQALEHAQAALKFYTDGAEDSNQREADEGKQKAQAVIDAIEELQGQGIEVAGTMTDVGQRF